MARPSPGVPEGCTAVVAVTTTTGQVRYVYVAAEVPADLSIPFSDRAIEGELQLDLPGGDYLTYWFAPETGRYFGWQSYAGTRGGCRWGYRELRTMS